jgi:hypothetical protein
LSAGKSLREKFKQLDD